MTRLTICGDELVCGCVPRAVESKGGASEEAGVTREQAIYVLYCTIILGRAGRYGYWGQKMALLGLVRELTSYR